MDANYTSTVVPSPPSSAVHAAVLDGTLVGGSSTAAVVLLAVVVATAVLLVRRRRSKGVPRKSASDTKEEAKGQPERPWHTDALHSLPAYRIAEMESYGNVYGIAEMESYENASVVNNLEAMLYPELGNKVIVNQHIGCFSKSPSTQKVRMLKESAGPICQLSIQAKIESRSHPISPGSAMPHSGSRLHKEAASLEHLYSPARFKKNMNLSISGTHGSVPLWAQSRSTASADSGIASIIGSFTDVACDEPGSRHSMTSGESCCLTFVNESHCVSLPSLQSSTASPGLEAAARGIPEEATVGCTLEVIADLAHQFQKLNASGDISVGDVYCTRSFSIGEFDQNGGCLSTPDYSCSLVIPPGALDKRQTVYFGIIYENGGTANEANFSPTYECGPNGLHFLKPVELHIRHCVGPGSDWEKVSAFVREGGTREWVASEGTGITNRDNDTVTMSITHFTGYKLAANMQSSDSTAGSSSMPSIRRSGIPRLTRQPVSVRKLLYLCCFRCGESKVRLYYMNRDDMLYDKICAQEEKLGNSLSSPKKPFAFASQDGCLMVKATQHETLERVETFSVNDVLSNSYDYVELSRAQNISSFEILIKQQTGSTASCIVATFETRNYTSEYTRSMLAVSCPYERLSEDQLVPFRPEDHPTSVQRLHGAHLLHLSSNDDSMRRVSEITATVSSINPPWPYSLSTLAGPEGVPQSALHSGGRKDCSSASSRTLCGPRGAEGLSLALATEGCECSTLTAGAVCSLHSRYLSPAECSDDGAALPPLSRCKNTRASKESGYSSNSSQLSPFASFRDLHGPCTMSQNEAAAAAAHGLPSASAAAGTDSAASAESEDCAAPAHERPRSTAPRLGRETECSGRAPVVARRQLGPS